MEKLRYIDRNPVKEGLVAEPELWEWSSYRSYASQEEGWVKLNLWPEGGDDDSDSGLTGKHNARVRHPLRLLQRVGFAKSGPCGI